MQITWNLAAIREVYKENLLNGKLQWSVTSGSFPAIGLMFAVHRAWPNTEL